MYRRFGFRSRALRLGFVGSRSRTSRGWDDILSDYFVICCESVYMSRLLCEGLGISIRASRWFEVNLRPDVRLWGLVAYALSEWVLLEL